MEPESVITLFDSLWYNQEFFKKPPNPSSPSNSNPNPPHKTQENPQEIVTTARKSRSLEVAKKRKILPRYKSLSELEFEELKGFMDLGFEFAEEDENYASLVEIIPGLLLHKLTKKSENCRVNDNYYKKSRPYLSEAWEAMEREKKKNKLMKWKIPAMSNQVDMKRNLRRWAHTVASTL